jgi:signal transduction histidine kinase
LKWLITAAACRERIARTFSNGFWRGPGERNEGAGLGLAIVSETMRAHRGGVSVADNPGGGAAFTLAFPSLPAGEAKMPGEGFAGGRI